MVVIAVLWFKPLTKVQRVDTSIRHHRLHKVQFPEYSFE